MTKTQISEQCLEEFSFDDFSTVSDEQRINLQSESSLIIELPYISLYVKLHWTSISDQHIGEVFGTQPQRKECIFDPGHFEIDFGDSIYSESKLHGVETRADPILIEILKLGIKASAGSYSKIFCNKFHSSFWKNIRIRENDGLESVAYNCQESIRSLVNDESILTSCVLFLMYLATVEVQVRYKFVS